MALTEPIREPVIDTLQASLTLSLLAFAACVAVLLLYGLGVALVVGG
ncbi:MAG TPA: hypothetical protein VFX91_04655 [Alcanivorax sp.]|nr:hypothetical protein [Alcanivorax sp.]